MKEGDIVTRSGYRLKEYVEGQRREEERKG
jgi:hypothetical protein